MTARKDVHSPGHNGVTQQDIDDAMEVAVGHIMQTLPATYNTYGPPPLESYLHQLRMSFGTGFAMGYRRAHVDCTVVPEPE